MLLCMWTYQPLSLLLSFSYYHWKVAFSKNSMKTTPINREDSSSPLKLVPQIFFRGFLLGLNVMMCVKLLAHCLRHREFNPCCLHREGEDEEGACGHRGCQAILTLWVTKRRPQSERGSNLSQHGIQIKYEREQNQYKTAALQSDMNSEKCY